MRELRPPHSRHEWAEFERRRQDLRQTAERLATLVLWGLFMVLVIVLGLIAGATFVYVRMLK